MEAEAQHTNLKREELDMENSKRDWRYDRNEEVKTLTGLYFIARGSSSPLFGCIIGQPCPGYYLATYHCGGLSELERADAHCLVQPHEMVGWHFFVSVKTAASVFPCRYLS